MQTTKFLSLVRQLIGKDLVTEVDSPSDFSMGGGTDTGASTASSGGTDTTSSTSTSTSTDNSSTDTSSSSDMSTADLGLDNSSMGAGLSPSYDVDVDMNDDNPDQQQSAPQAPKFRILDVMFDEDDDLNTKVKIQNIDTGKVEIKRLDEIII